MKTIGLNKVENVVRDVLIQREDARNSNDVLYYLVVERFARENGIPLQGKRFETVMMNISNLNLPKYETVTRARRKLCEKYPDLRGSDQTEAKRLLAEEVFHEYGQRKKYCEG